MIKLSNLEEVINNHHPFWLLPFFIFILLSVPCSSQKNHCGIPDTSACYVNEKFISPKFIKLEKKWESDEITSVNQIPLLGDIDGDCIPDFLYRIPIIAPPGEPDTTRLKIIDSRNGKLKSEFKCLPYHTNQMTFVLVDVDNDGIQEIIMGTTFDTRVLACYEMNGKLKWLSTESYININNNTGAPSLGISDFNQDGIPEVYCNNRIFNAQTGILLAEGSWKDGSGSNFTPFASHQVCVAAQLDDNSNDLELAAGFTIYKIKITNLNGLSGNSITPHNIQVDGKYLDGKTAVADINMDGQLDVIVSHAAFDVSSRIYVYTMQNGMPILLSKNYILGNSEMNGCPSISDIDGDGKPNILVLKQNHINNYVYDGTNTLLLVWSFLIKDINAYGGIVTFDLNGDGKSEIIHRGDSLLYVIDGSTNPPTLIDKATCWSITLNENCIIADIDNTGQSKICTMCAPGPNSNLLGRLTVFGSPDSLPSWAPARGIWNQYAYNPLFINDDLTVPRVQKNQATCMNGKYNNFMQQESLLDENGYYKKPAASLTGKINSIDLDPRTSEYILKFEIYNRADASLPADSAMPVSFYNGDPSVGGTLIGVYHTLKKIYAGDSLLNLEFRFYAANLSRVFMVVNTLRNTTGAFEAKDFSILECDYSDNTFQTTAPPIIKNPNPCKPDFSDTSLCFINEKFIPIPFQIEKKWVTLDSVNIHCAPLVADIDSNCTPELLSSVSHVQKIEIFDTEFGIFKSSFDTDINAISFSPTLICDIDKDGIYEIIIHIMDRGNGPIQMRDRLVCYDLLGNIKWISSDRVELYYNKSIGYPYPGPLSIADFNQDGIPELFVSNLIFNAQTGVLLIRGGDNGVGTGRDSIYPPMSVAADLDANPTDLELAAGFTIYKVILTNLNGQTGNQMIPNNIKINSTLHDGVTSVADINLDGQLDVIVYSRITFNIFILYVYTLVGNIPVLLASSILNGGSKFISSPVISNVNNTNLSIIIARTFELLSFRYDGSTSLVLEWNFKTSDHSGFCNPTVFDLNGDGVQEILYKDETDFYVLNLIANQPTVIKKINCYSSTGHEMPIVFGSGFNSEARVCVVCNNSWWSSFGNITVFGPPDGQRWAPARPVWNQYAYNPLFINDDLTVPRYQKNHATYKNGKYNNFLQQESLLDENGYYKKPAASLTGLIHCVDYDPVTDSFTVRFELHNRGDASRVADVDLPVSFYGANPELDTTLLGVYLTTEIIRPGDSLRDLRFRFSASDLTRIYLVVNTRRNTTGPFDSTHFDQPECDYTDNFYYLIDLPKIQRDSVSICEGSTYMFYDTTLYDAGKYNRSLKNQKGCDSLIVLLDLSLSNTVRTQTGISVCEEYDWNGKLLTQTGIYSDTSLTSSGCDSIVTLDLTVHSSIHSTHRMATCDSYIWNGQTYTQSGQYVFNGQTENGCDSIVTLDLIIHQSSNSINRIATCESYLWNGNNYTQTGIYEFKTQNSVGCDSTAILDLTIDSVIRQQISHTTCDRYIWNGQTLNQSGTYTHQDISQSGCDSIMTLDLTVLSSTNSINRIATCDSYLWNGQTYTQSGIYQFSSKNADGCDSIATLELTILSSSNSMSQISTCESYLWNGQNYTQSGSYEFKTQNAAGCDSTSTLKLTILPIHQNNIQESACDQYIWNGITYDQSGNYTFNTKNQFGCDSSITLELEILKSSSANISLYACDSLIFQGQTLTESGTYPFTIRNAAGCDSVILLNLSINSVQQISSVSSCDPYRWDVDGQTYAQSGRYLKTFTNTQGCDSVHILDFKRLPSHLINEKAEVCGPFYWNVTNTLLDQSGNYSHPLQTTDGCDSLLNLELIIHPHFIKTDTIISQTDYIWPVNNTTYSASGNFEEKFSSEFGCDSIHRLILIIKNEQGICYPNVLIPGGISGGFTIFDNLFTIASITTLSIYDRWGSLVWQKHNFAPNDPTLGWDGRFKNQHVVPGVYTWHAQLTLKDGTYTTVKGDLTVVR